jgi:hypothetical protein
MEAIIEVTENNVRIGVEFSELNREEGFNDDIRISLSEPGPKEHRRLFSGDQISFLMTPAQAEKLGSSARRCWMPRGRAEAHRRNRRRTTASTRLATSLVCSLRSGSLKCASW